MDNYNHQKIEEKWQKKWSQSGLYQIDLDEDGKEPFYNLMMFPYPSAEGLHIGSVYTFSGIDTYGRFKRMQGYNVFQPFGLDGFGIHSENYAIKIKENILDVSKRTKKHYYEQMTRTGTMIDTSRFVETFEIGYYKWTQWLFVQLFKAGLAYRKESDVIWCPSCKTVLAYEQVEDGVCERCKTDVERKSMEQWFFKITDYAQRLLDNLETLDWVEDVKLGQRNWIGRKEGIEIDYLLVDADGEPGEQVISVFTTRPDTNFGSTFVVISPEHPLVDQLVKPEYEKAVKDYLDEVAKKSDLERTDLAKEKTGVFTGSYCYNRLTKKKLPIWIADFVLMNFGTGVVVGVPGHDPKDFEFAKKYELPVIRVVKKGNDDSPIESIDQVFEDAGTMVNSEFLNGLDIMDAKEKIKDRLEAEGWGRRTVSYRLRDWCVSRQRYWGPPIPMIYCEHCARAGKGFHAEEMPGWWPEENLPVELPEIHKFEDTLPDGSGKGPLAKFPEFYDTTCPECNSEAVRETDVSDPFVDSSWYYLRYPFTEFDQVPFGGDFTNPNSEFSVKLSEQINEKLQTRMRKWGPVTSYIGGKEHTVLHLLYARFINMVFYDLGYLDFEEPFSRFYGHGLITKDGSKMSKSKGNIINPDEYFNKYGADAVRLYLRFMGPFDQGGDWSDQGMKGMYRFVKKLWGLYADFLKEDELKTVVIDDAKIDQTVKQVGEDLDNLKFNTAIAKLMELINWYQEISDKMPTSQKRHFFTNLTLMIAPLAPHLADELWEKLGNKESVHLQSWPKFDQKKLAETEKTIAVQFNGKTRGTLAVPSGSSKEEVELLVIGDPKLSQYHNAKKIRKIIFVEDKIINFVQ